MAPYQYTEPFAFTSSQHGEQRGSIGALRYEADYFLVTDYEFNPSKISQNNRERMEENFQRNKEMFQQAVAERMSLTSDKLPGSFPSYWDSAVNQFTTPEKGLEKFFDHSDRSEDARLSRVNLYGSLEKTKINISSTKGVQVAESQRPPTVNPHVSNDRS